MARDEKFILKGLSHCKVVVDDLLCCSSVVVVVETRGGEAEGGGCIRCCCCCILSDSLNSPARPFASVDAGALRIVCNPEVLTSQHFGVVCAAAAASTEWHSTLPCAPP